MSARRPPPTPAAQYSFTGPEPQQRRRLHGHRDAARRRQPPGPDLDHRRGRRPPRPARRRLHDRPDDQRRHQHRQLLREPRRWSPQGLRLPRLQHHHRRQPDHLDHRPADRRHHRRAHRHRRVRQPVGTTTTTNAGGLLQLHRAEPQQRGRLHGHRDRPDGRHPPRPDLDHRRGRDHHAAEHARSVSNIVLTHGQLPSTDNFFETRQRRLNGTDYLVPTGTALTTSTTGDADRRHDGHADRHRRLRQRGHQDHHHQRDAGQYSFPGLNPSNAAGYIVTETPPTGLQPRRPDLDHGGRRRPSPRQLPSSRTSS